MKMGLQKKLNVIHIVEDASANTGGGIEAEIKIFPNYLKGKRLLTRILGIGILVMQQICQACFQMQENLIKMLAVGTLVM